MRRIKSESRSSLKSNTLNALMMISMEGPPLQVINFNEMVEIWYQQKPRRLRLSCNRAVTVILTIYIYIVFRFFFSNPIRSFQFAALLFFIWYFFYTLWMALSFIPFWLLCILSMDIYVFILSKQGQNHESMLILTEYFW